MESSNLYMQMKSNENYIVWNPDDIAPCSADYVEICEDEDALRFVVNCGESVITVSFFGIVPAYMFSEEGMRMMSWSIAQEKNKDRFYFTKWPIYKVENSCMIHWALMESCGYYSEDALTHYCIVTDQEIVDIISMCEPRITVDVSGLSGADIQ